MTVHCFNGNSARDGDICTGCDTDGGHKCSRGGFARDGNICGDCHALCGNEYTVDGKIRDGNAVCSFVGKVYEDGNIGDGAYDSGGVYGVLVVQYQPPNLFELTDRHQSEQLALSIPPLLAASELLFVMMLRQSQSQGN
ncbi:hypothetical protein [Scytonema sp. PRP1]|uniref:hypothetical protein n=1 Tax=Scytonema sp. PRP1 TaxID=3120513 RepID=UPI002FD03769